MNARLSPLTASAAVLLSLAGSLAAQQPGQPMMRDQQDMVNAEQLVAQGKYKEALKLYEGIPQNYPTSPYIPSSNLRAGVCYYFLKEWDKAIASASKNFVIAKDRITPEVLEQSYVFVPNVYTLKAENTPEAEGTLKTKTYQDAIKGYDDVIAKFPNSPEVETALFGKGKALGQVQDFEKAAKTFQEAIDKFPKSPSLLDTKYYMGMVLYFQGATTVNNQGAEGAGAKAALDEAEKVFREIIAARSDLAIMNGAFKQLGEILALKARLAPRDSEESKKLLDGALESFRQVRSKDEILAAQDARIRFFEGQIEVARRSANLEGIRLNTRQVEKEREKLEGLKAQPDQAAEAKTSASLVFLALGKFDEVRVLLRYAEGLLTDENKDERKKIEHFVFLTYAGQHVMDKAEELYTKFKGAYQNDPMGDNHAFAMAEGYLDEDPKVRSIEKAIKYLDEQVATYPNSPITKGVPPMRANTQFQSGQVDAAIKTLQEYINTNPPKEQLAQAKFNMALMLKDSGKTEDAVKTLREVRDQFEGLPQAEQAAFWLGATLAGAGDNTAGLTELNAFISKFPESTLMPNAIYFKARAQAATNDYPGAMASYKVLMDKYPDAEPTASAYFETGGILQAQIDGLPKDQQDYTKVRDVMKDFVAKYPTSDRVYSATAFSAQLLEKEGKLDDAIKTYQDYIAGHEGDPSVARAHLSIATIEKGRAEKLGSFYSLSKEQQEQWKSWMDAATKNAEQGIEKVPESDTVSGLLEVLLKIESLRLAVGQKKEEDVKSYFTQLAAKFDAVKSTKTKILFVVANFLADRDKEKKGDWFDLMKSVYDPELVYSPSDLDRYGNELVNRKELAQAKDVFDKIAKDYPVPPNAEPGKVTRTVGEAQSVSLAGRARILQAEGKGAEGQALAEELKKLYPWSGKVAEADYQIAVGLIETGKLEEGVDLLGEVVKKTTVPVSLRAKGMMLIAKTLEKQQDYDNAVNNFIKIATFFESEEELAAEGLFRGAEILEQQATGKIALPKAKPKINSSKPGAKPAADGKKPAAGDKKAAAAKPEAKK